MRALTPRGRSEWTTELDHEVIDLAGTGETLVATTHDRSVETTASDHARVVAFDLSSGEHLWAPSFEDHVEGLALADETIYTTVVTEREDDVDVIGKRLVTFG